MSGQNENIKAVNVYEYICCYQVVNTRGQWYITVTPSGDIASILSSRGPSAQNFAPTLLAVDFFFHFNVFIFVAICTPYCEDVLPWQPIVWFLPMCFPCCQFDFKAGWLFTEWKTNKVFISLSKERLLTWHELFKRLPVGDIFHGYGISRGRRVETKFTIILNHNLWKEESAGPHVTTEAAKSWSATLINHRNVVQPPPCLFHVHSWRPYFSFKPGLFEGWPGCTVWFHQEQLVFQAVCRWLGAVVLLLSAAVIEITRRSSAGRRANGRPGLRQSASHAFFTLSSCPSTFTLLKPCKKLSGAAEALKSSLFCTAHENPQMSWPVNKLADDWAKKKTPKKPQ